MLRSWLSLAAGNILSRKWPLYFRGNQYPSFKKGFPFANRLTLNFITYSILEFFL